MQRICLLVLIGIPASGKTTFSKLLLRTNSMRFNVLHLCFDELFGIPNTNEVHTHRQQRQKFLNILESLIVFIQSKGEIPIHYHKFNYCQNNSENDWLIVCDDNHYYQSMRYKVYQLARRHLTSFAQLHFQCDLSIALMRNKNRNAEQRVPNHIIEQMHETIDLPEPLLRSWEQNTLTLNTNLTSANVLQLDSIIIEFFEAAFKEYVCPINEANDKSISQQSLVHQLDLLLRKRIKNKMSEDDCTTASQKCEKATLLNRKRQSLLKDFAKLFDTNPKIVVTPFNLQQYVESL